MSKNDICMTLTTRNLICNILPRCVLMHDMVLLDDNAVLKYQSNVV